MTTPNDSVVSSGHQVALLVGGKLVGYARSANINQDFGVEPIYTIGDIMPKENAPLRWSGNIDIDKFFIRKDLAQGGANFDVSADGILEASPIDVTIIDKGSQKVLIKALRCTLTSVGISITSNAFTGERATLVPERVERPDTMANTIV